ncbi:MAG: NAD(P)/FAD-dependent oxidoreductase [Pseudomonadota bacterium]
MLPLNRWRINRRRFIKISGLWATAAALGVQPVHASKKSRTPVGAYDAAVIGSGLGGLTFAGYMAKNGYKVLVLEQHDVPGGYATTFSRDGGRFTFDVSLHQTSLAGSTRQILEDLDVLKKVRFYKCKELFRYVCGDLDIKCPGGDPKALERILTEKFPDEKKGIEHFLGEMSGIVEETERLSMGGKLGIVDKAAFPMRFPKLWAARKKSLADYINESTSNPQLIGVMSAFCGYYGLPPRELSGFYYMIATGGYVKHGGDYPHGGSQAVSNAIAEMIESNGGEVRLGTKVNEVVLENGRAVGVKTVDGTVEKAKVVVANCSIYKLFGDMLPKGTVKGDFAEKLGSARPSVSSFIVWLGLNQDITERIKDSHIFLQGQADPEKAHRYGLMGDVEKLNLGICIYNNMYKDYSPPGTTVLSIIFTTGYEPWKRYEKAYSAGNKTDYLAKKNEIADAMIKRVEKALIPGLSGMTAVKEAATPLTNVRYTLNTDGAIYGLDQTPDNAFMNRISNRTPVKGLYLSSAWGDPGAGYAGVLIAGKKTFGLVMEDLG